MGLEEMSIEERRARSALVLVVPDVEDLVSPYRRTLTADGANVPAHITLMSPFFAPSEMSSGVNARIGRIAGAFPAFDFSLTGVARFPGGVMYLTPEPVQPFLDLIRMLRQEFTEVSPYWDQFPEVIPHTTVADAALADDSISLDQVESAIWKQLPVQCSALEVLLVQRTRPVPAPWDVTGRFALAQND